MKKKIFKVLLILILIVILIVTLKFGYNLCFYKKLLRAEENALKTKNYACIYYNRGEKLDLETGKWSESYSKMVLKVKGDKYVTQNFRNSDEDYALAGTTYRNVNEKESVYLSVEDNEFSISPNLIPPDINTRFTNYPIYDYIDGLIAGDSTLKYKVYTFCSFYIPMVFSLKFDNVVEDGKEYIVLSYKESETKIYFNKDTLLAEKEIMKSGRSGETVVNAYWEIELGNVTDEEVSVPDLSNFRQAIY